MTLMSRWLYVILFAASMPYFITFLFTGVKILFGNHRRPAIWTIIWVSSKKLSAYRSVRRCIQYGGYSKPIKVRIVRRPPPPPTLYPNTRKLIPIPPKHPTSLLVSRLCVTTLLFERPNTTITRHLRKVLGSVILVH